MRLHSLSMRVEYSGSEWTVTWHGATYSAASWHEAYLAALRGEAGRV